MSPHQLAEILRRDLESGAADVASISDVRHLSSYNWIESPEPTTAVPGCPPLWSPPKAPQKVDKDSGLIYIAQNAARHPEYPLEPLFRSLYVDHPSFELQSVDLVTDRNNIRKLLSFINPKLSRNGLESFTINVEAFKNTVIFCRAETETKRFIHPDEFMGFGHEFEKAFTTDQIDGSTGHHRIISYQFSDLRIMVRYETDAYVAKPITRNTEMKNEDLASMIHSLSLSSTSNALTGSKLKIQRAGRSVGIESTLEIKTRVYHKPIDIEEVLSQLWVSQTPNLVRAYHKHGIFVTPKVENVAPEIKKWEENHQLDLKRLAALIRKVILIMEENDGNAVIKYEPQDDKLDPTKDSNKIFNAVLFVVSHSGTFKWRVRTVVRAAYEERFVISSKQKATLDRWNKPKPAEDVSDDYVTTEDDFSEPYLSDDS